MNSFENRVYNFILQKEMISPGSTVLVGFSGGADSTALLLVLWQLRRLLDIKLFAVHVNHGIREEAGEDAEFTRQFCKKHDISYQLVEKDIPALSREWKMTEEEAGRKVRYEAFETVAGEQKAAFIATAHHQNDVAETLLMNLLRGSGIHGAGGIRPVRGNIIRPLLCVNRFEIEEYLREKNQDYCHDATNDENIHTRNIIRNVLLPAMEKEINAASVSHLCRVSEEFARADDFIRSSSKECFEKIVSQKDNGLGIDLIRFRELHEAVKPDIILMCMEKLTPHRKDITASHIEALLDLSEGSKGSAFMDLPYGLMAERNYDVLTITKKDIKNSRNNNEQFNVPQLMEIGDKTEILIPDLGMAHIEILQYNVGKLFPTSAYTKWFDYDRIQGAIFRKRRPDDYILVEQGEGLCKKKISKLMTDEKIPRSKRDEMYLLADGSDIIWVPGYRMSGAYKVSENTNRILAINIDNGGNI
ncbi:MAG: tRNA lysidine(34) synthetase TilS [Butyrivibrio sp.]|nr:tRNA lysidine(34) synthetase TilS [Butyrivibrio sp.]